MQALDPVDVDFQKHTALVKYKNDLQTAEQLFSNTIRDRTVKLMAGVSIFFGKGKVLTES